MESLDEKLIKALEGSVEVAEKIGEYTIRGGGKRIRPRTVPAVSRGHDSTRGFLREAHPSIKTIPSDSSKVISLVDEYSEGFSLSSKKSAVSLSGFMDLNIR